MSSFIREPLTANQWNVFLPTALSNSDGEFFLNGNFVITMAKKEIRIGKALIEYSGSDTLVEKLNCSGRIEQELLLQVNVWPWAHSPLLPLELTRPANTISILSAHPRCCRWGNCSIPICTTLSMSPLKTGPRSSTGTVMGPGRPAANPAKVSDFQLSLGGVSYPFSVFIFPVLSTYNWYHNSVCTV